MAAWRSPSVPTSVAIAPTTLFRLVLASCTSEAKFGSVACELDIEPIVAKARIRSRMYEPVELPADGATEFALANKPVCTVLCAPTCTIGELNMDAGCDM